MPRFRLARNRLIRCWPGLKGVGWTPFAFCLLLCASLAGCASTPGVGSRDCDGFCARPAAAGAESGEAYLFTANVAAAAYAWDFGDHTTGTGAEVRHVYAFHDGKVTAKLLAQTGDEVKTFAQPVVVGTGNNARATYLLEAETDWLVTGTPVTFSAAASSDPEGDGLLLAVGSLFRRV